MIVLAVRTSVCLLVFPTAVLLNSLNLVILYSIGEILIDIDGLYVNPRMLTCRTIVIYAPQRSSSFAKCL